MTTDFDWPDLEGCARAELGDARATLDSIRALAAQWAHGPTHAVTAQHAADLLRLLDGARIEDLPRRAPQFEAFDRLSPWQPTVTEGGAHAIWVMLEPESLEWAPAGTHVYTPPQCGDSYARLHHDTGSCDVCQEAVTHPLICVKAFHWLRWTQVEHTDSAGFRDEATGAEWEIVRLITARRPSPGEPQLQHRITYTGRPASLDHGPFMRH